MFSSLAEVLVFRNSSLLWRAIVVIKEILFFRLFLFGGRMDTPQSWGSLGHFSVTTPAEDQYICHLFFAKAFIGSVVTVENSWCVTKLTTILGLF